MFSCLVTFVMQQTIRVLDLASSSRSLLMLIAWQRACHLTAEMSTRRVDSASPRVEARRGEAILTPDSSRLVSPRLGKTRRTDRYIRYVENDSACHQNAI